MIERHAQIRHVFAAHGVLGTQPERPHAELEREQFHRRFAGGGGVDVPVSHGEQNPAHFHHRGAEAVGGDRVRRDGLRFGRLGEEEGREVCELLVLRDAAHEVLVDRAVQEQRAVERRGENEKVRGRVGLVKCRRWNGREEGELNRSAGDDEVSFVRDAEWVQACYTSRSPSTSTENVELVLVLVRLRLLDLVSDVSFGPAFEEAQRTGENEEAVEHLVHQREQIVTHSDGDAVVEIDQNRL